MERPFGCYSPQIISTNTPEHTFMYFFLFKNIDLFFFLGGYCPFTRQRLLSYMKGFGSWRLLCVTCSRRTIQLQDQCGENPVARLQPTTGVISHIFTTRSVPQVTISPLAMSMDIWEMLCFPS